MLDTFDICQQIPVPVLGLVAFCQALFIWCFHADKDGVEARLIHQSHQFVIICQINRNFRTATQPHFVLAPLNERRQQLCFEMLLVPDQVIVYKEEIAAPAEAVKIL